MSVIIKRDSDGTETIIDCEPIDKYVKELAKACLEESRPESLYELADGMDREQLRHLLSIVTCMTRNYARLWNASFKPAHAKLLQDLNEIRQAAKDQNVDLWPELE